MPERRTPTPRVDRDIVCGRVASKITHGNSVDQLHACQVFDADVLVTTDRAFYEALLACRAAGALTGAVRMIDRGASSAVAELAAVLT